MPADFAVTPPVATPGEQQAAAPPKAPRLFHDEEAPSWADSYPDGDDAPPSPVDESFPPNWDLDADAESAERASAEPGEKPVAAQPKAEEPKAPSSEDLQRELQTTREELATLGKRFADTQKYANQEHMANTVASAIVQAQRHQEYLQQQLRQRQADAAPPDLGDLDELLSDPKKLQQGMHRYADWGYQRAVADLSPHVSTMRQELNEVALMRPLAENFARSEATRSLVAKGVLDQAQAEKLIERGLSEVINTHQDARNFRINPEAIEYAAGIILQREGAPIKNKPKETPTAGAGDQKRPQRRTGLSPTGEKVTRHIESMFGVSFDANDRAELARMNRGA